MRAFGVPPFRQAAFLLLALCTLTIVQTLAQQPLQPAPPEKFKVKLRYRILALRDQHVKQYDELVAFLLKQKLEFDPPLEDRPNTDREDTSKNVFEGLVPSGNPLRLFGTTNVASVLLIPSNLKLPEDVNVRVKVRLELASGFPLERQVTLVNQVLLLLGELDYREAFGFDNRGYTGQPHTRLVGTIPVHQLDMLLKDLRTRPGGWLAPGIAPEDLPQPLRQVNPILVTEVLPEPVPARDLILPEPPNPPYLDKLSRDLSLLLLDKNLAQSAVSLEVILAFTPAEEEGGWWLGLKKAAPDMVLEGRLGPVVTVLTRAANAQRLAALPWVTNLRLPQASFRLAGPTATFATDNPKVLEQSGLARLHKLGKRGILTMPSTIHYPKARERKLRLAIIDDDFTGYAQLLQAKKLPADTRLVDLTIQQNPNLFAVPTYQEPKQLGHGTQCALAALLAAPDVQLTLVRVDPAKPYQIQEVARYINGEPLDSPLVDLRRQELVSAGSVLSIRRATIMEERKFVLDNFQDERDFEEDFGILGDNVSGWLLSARQWHRRRLGELEDDEAVQRFRDLRFRKFIGELLTLRGIDLVCCTFAWTDRWPLGTSSALSRWFDQTPQKAVWFQSAGNQRGQTWYGIYRDVDGNNIMEFAAPDTKLAKNRWTRELNFLSWQSLTPGGDKGEARLRVSIQWREPHDPDYFFRLDERDRYRQPLASLRLVVLRQRDPSGKVLPSDDFEPIALTAGTVQRLDNRPQLSTYEQAVEFPIDRSSRYAVFVVRQQPERWDLVEKSPGRYLMVLESGLTPTGIRPLGVPTLPGLEKKWELWSRLFVECVDPVASTEGRMVFEEYATDQGTIGMLADARTVITVGAAQLSGKPQPYSSAGPPMGLVGFPKPNVLAYDALEVALPGLSKAYGSDVATAFATGQAACLLSAGMTRAQLTQFLQKQNGAVLRVPDNLPGN